MLAAQTLAVLPEPLRRAIEGFADEYLAEGVPFGGRDDELAALDAWLADDRRPCALVVAEAGRGKSALLARWVRRVTGRAAAPAVVFVPVSIRFGTAQRMSSLRLLAAQLRRLSGATGEAPRDPEAARAEIEAMLAQPRGDGARWLVVLDGIDEAVGWQVSRELRLPPDPGPGLKVLVSARALAGCDLDGWRKRLGWRAERTMGLALRGLDARCVADVLRKMGDPLAALGERSEMARMLARVTEGDPLVLRLYVDALRAQGDAVAFVTPADLSAMPPGLDGYFDRWWAEQRLAWRGAAGHLERDARDLLCALATALGPLAREDLDALVPDRDPEVRDATLHALGRFVIGDGRTRGYVFSHPRLAYYHAERMSAEERAAWERRFVGYGESVRARLAGGGRAAEYVVRHHGAHLERSGAGFRELSRLVVPAWQRAWEALEGSFEGFLGDVERATARSEVALVEDAAEGAAAAAALYRLALVRASAGDVAHNVPGPLLVGLVEAGLWSPAVAFAYAGGRALEVAALAHLLPMPLVRAALAMCDGPTTHSSVSLRPAVLDALLRRLIEAGAAHEVVPAVARQTPEARVRVLLALAPRMPEAVRPLAWTELRATIEDLDEWDGRGAFLLELAAQVPHDQRGPLRAKAEALLEEEGHEAEHVTLFGLAGDHERALQLARDQRDPRSRSRYFAHAVAGTRGAAQMLAFHEWALAERALWSTGETVLRSEWQRPWPLPPPPLPRPLLGAFVALVRELPFPRERAFAFAQLAQVHGAAISEALAAVRALDGPDRALGLLAIAGVLDGAERDAALDEALAAIRARDWGVPSEAWHRADIDWQSPDGRTGWHHRAPRTAAELLATAARLLPRDQRAPVLREALSRSRTIGDDGYRGQMLAAMAARLDGTARAEVLAAALSAARASPGLLDRARALSHLAPEFPEAGREAVATLAAIELGDHLGEAIAFGAAAARSLPEPERGAAIRTLFEIRSAHRDQDAGSHALRALAPHLPAALLERAARGAYIEELSMLAAHGGWADERRLAAMTGVVRAIEPRDGRPDHVQSQMEDCIEELAPRLSMPLLRQALAWASRMAAEGGPRRRTWLLHVLLPRLAELGETREAVELARTIADPLGRAGVLCALIPQLVPPLRDTVVAEVMARVRAVSQGRGDGDDNVLEVHYFLELASVVGAHGHGLELAEVAGRLLERWRALSVWVKLAAATSPPERGAVLAMAVASALATPGGYHFKEFDELTGLFPHAAELDRRGLAKLFGRALRHASRDGRSHLFVGATAKVSSWVVCALEALGGRAAIRDAAQACREVAAWFP